MLCQFWWYCRYLLPRYVWQPHSPACFHAVSFWTFSSFVNNSIIYSYQVVDDDIFVPRCSPPTCTTGSLDRSTCRCGRATQSTCPKGFTEIVNNHRLCSCERKSIPTCPKGFRFDIGSCECSISQRPTCPAGSSIIPHSALCTGTAKPTCPPNAVLHPDGCQCVMEYVRQCPPGSKLSWNGCECTSTSTTPICTGRCSLLSRGCSCQRLTLGKNVFWELHTNTC